MDITLFNNILLIKENFFSQIDIKSIINKTMRKKLKDYDSKSSNSIFNILSIFSIDVIINSYDNRNLFEYYIPLANIEAEIYDSNTMNNFNTKDKNNIIREIYSIIEERIKIYIFSFLRLFINNIRNSKNHKDYSENKNDSENTDNFDIISCLLKLIKLCIITKIERDEREYKLDVSYDIKNNNSTDTTINQEIKIVRRDIIINSLKYKNYYNYILIKLEVDSSVIQDKEVISFLNSIKLFSILNSNMIINLTFKEDAFSIRKLIEINELLRSRILDTTIIQEFQDNDNSNNPLYNSLSICFESDNNLFNEQLIENKFKFNIINKYSALYEDKDNYYFEKTYINNSSKLNLFYEDLTKQSSFPFTIQSYVFLFPINYRSKEKCIKFNILYNSELKDNSFMDKLNIEEILETNKEKFKSLFGLEIKEELFRNCFGLKNNNNNYSVEVFLNYIDNNNDDHSNIDYDITSITGITKNFIFEFFDNIKQKSAFYKKYFSDKAEKKITDELSINVEFLTNMIKSVSTNQDLSSISNEEFSKIIFKNSLVD